MSGFWDWFKPKPPGAQGPVHVDLYQILGISPDATSEQVTKGFRELAMKFHPDRNQGDPTAEAKYTEISQAYAILSDEAKRAEYDRSRPQEAPRSFYGGIIPRGPEPREALVKVPPKPQGVHKPLQTKSMIEKMFGVAKEEQPKGSMFEILSPGPPQQPPARIPVPGTPFSPLNPSAGRVPMMPGVEIPDNGEIWQIIQQWPLDPIWDLVRGERRTPEFQRAGAMAVDALAGSGQQPAEWDLAEIFNIPVRQVQDFVNTKGRQSFYVTVMYPIFDTITQMMDKLKPPDIPGKFFLDWDPNGRVIELIYAESIGRKP